nr:hypothetical protein [Bacillus pumilus]
MRQTINRGALIAASIVLKPFGTHMRRAFGGSWRRRRRFYCTYQQ